MSNSHQPEVRPYLMTKTLVPENQETPIHFINGDIVTNRLFLEEIIFLIHHLRLPFIFFQLRG